MATAYVIFEILNYQESEILFNSRSGILKVSKDEDRFTMSFPIQEIKECMMPSSLESAFGKRAIACYRSIDYLLIFEDEEDIVNLNPNIELLKQLDARGVIVTAKSQEYDFVLRYFAPKIGIDEDPVTGSVFTELVPYWSRVLQKDRFKAKQLSQRSGEVFCAHKGDRVEIAGYVAKYLEGYIAI